MKKYCICFLIIVIIISGHTPQDYSTKSRYYNAQISDDESENTVYITATGECYHRANCSSLYKSCFKSKKDEAMAKGYRECSNCFGNVK